MKRKLLFLMSLLLISLSIYAQDTSTGRLSLSTGFGTPGRFGSHAKLQLPIHLAYENTSTFGILPDFISTGLYIRYSKLKYELTFFTSTISYDYTLTGFGGRATLDVGQLIQHIAGEAKLPKILQLYGGFQAGYDIIKVSNSKFEATSLGSTTRFEPFVGVGTNLGERFGLHVEFGNTAPAIVGVGASVKL